MITIQNNAWNLIMTSKKIILVVKICIALLWITAMYAFVYELIHNEQSVKVLFLKHWIVFCVIFLGCLSVLMDRFYIKRNISLIYFLIVCFSFIVLVLRNILVNGMNK